MAQEIIVLRCVSCETFQSQIVKKTRKWECKVCGTKQSIKKVYGRGSGRDCRLHTQKLNALKGDRNSPNKIKYENVEECFERRSSHRTEHTNLAITESVEDVVLVIPPGNSDTAFYINNTKNKLNDLTFDFKAVSVEDVHSAIMSLNTELSDLSKWAEYIDEELLSSSNGLDNIKYNNVNDFDVKITHSQGVRKRKHNFEQSLCNKSSLIRPLQLPVQADLNKKVQTKDEICFKTTKTNRDVKDGIIKPQAKEAKIVQTPSVKWGKYLVKRNEELSTNLSQTSLTWFPAKSNGFENIEPKRTLFSSKNHEDISNLQTPEKSMTIYANQIFSGLSNQTLKHTSRDKQSLLGVQCFDENNKITTEQQSKQKPLVSTQGFECDNNFTDIDFQLDF